MILLAAIVSCAWIFGSELSAEFTEVVARIQVEDLLRRRPAGRTKTPVFSTGYDAPRVGLALTTAFDDALKGLERRRFASAQRSETVRRRAIAFILSAPSFRPVSR